MFQADAFISLISKYLEWSILIYVQKKTGGLFITTKEGIQSGKGIKSKSTGN